MPEKSLQDRDRILVQQLRQRARARHVPPGELLEYLELEYVWTREKLETVKKLLESRGALTFDTRDVLWRDQDGEERTIPILRATTTEMWPMGTQWYARDNILVPALLLRSGYGSQAKNKALFLSALTILSSRPQLQRFQNTIKSSDEHFIHNAQHWPQIFLTIKDNINAVRAEKWAHRQDAWQMLAYYTLRLLEDGLLAVEDLTEKHKQFLSLVVPFLAKVRYWEEENSGSWEEIEARKTSVMAWDASVIDQYQKSAQRHPEWIFLKFDPAGKGLAEIGFQAMASRLPFESPDYTENDPHYREADAALIYLLQLNCAGVREAQLLEQIEKLSDARTGGIRRYLNDSYQGPNFFHHEIAQRLTELYGAPSDDASGIEHFMGRRAIVPEGPEAAWVHFVWQLSSWAGQRFQKTREQRYWEMQQRYFSRGLGLITGEGEVSLDQDAQGQSRVIEVPAWRIPEAYITEIMENGEQFIIPSPHTPLNWAVGEAIYALAMMKKSLDMSP